MHQLYMDDVILKEEFLEWYRNTNLKMKGYLNGTWMILKNCVIVIIRLYQRPIKN